MLANQLWVEKYRPSKVDDYVFVNEDTREQVVHWINTGNFPHLMLHGPSGTGKTTLAKLLIRNLDINDLDILYVNGSQEGRKIDWLREKVEGFCQTMPFGSFKVILIDEADYLNKESVQPAMRNLMEEYSDSVRFIMTCNFPHKILQPLRSRCHEIKIDKTDQTEYTARAATVLVNENIDFDLDTLDNYVRSCYPDLRKCLMQLQANSTTGRLIMVAATGTADYRVRAVELFKHRRYKEARQLICAEANPNEMEELFRWSYDNLDLWSDIEEGQDEAILIIRRSYVNHASCADPEINIAAMLIELCSIGKS
jgi:DNA polymerase III delta prime subunit